jgi:branched-chain amino acid transport system substrate-binding protein
MEPTTKRQPVIASPSGITRRKFMKACVIGAAGMAAMERVSFAGADAPVLIGFPVPLTGPLADFGEGTQWVADRAIETINRAGGLPVGPGGGMLPVKAVIVDTESKPANASQLAARLILKDRVDLMLTLHTPDTVNPVTAVCERYKIPCISLDAPVESWLAGGPYEWSFHAFWTVDALSDLYIDAWDRFGDQTNRVVGGLWPNDPDGVSWSEAITRKLQKRGYRVVDPGRFSHGLADFSAVVDQFSREGVEIVTGVMVPPDWAVAWGQFYQQGVIPKIVTMGKAILFPSALNAMPGNLPHGLTAEVWWSPHHPFRSSLTGETPKAFCDAWTEAHGKPWAQPLGFKHAGFEIVFDVLKRAGSRDPEKIRQALKTTDLSTIVGPIRYNEKQYAETPLVFGQWVKGERWPWELEIVYNAGRNQIPVTRQMLFPLIKTL